jgi:N6-adenosine-specific RNA methylase IME4
LTTQKYLPMTLRLLDQWGFKYVLTMVWHKPGGFQPIGLPQYNCEFVVYGRKGSPKFIETKAFPCAFFAPRREHSRKPDSFYEVIKRVTDEGRIDVFSRERREGFEQFGNETEKFRNAS